MTKKVLAILTVLILLVTASCGTKPPVEYKDGTYSGTYSHFDNHGWKPQVEITVKNGKISEVIWDYVSTDGGLKSQNQGYADMMSGKSGITPAEAGEELAKRTIKLQTADIDDVAGATHSSEGFRELASAVLMNAVKGDNSMVVLPMQGTYKASDEPDDRGWMAELSMTFDGAKIIAVEYLEMNEEGALKIDDSNYANMMSEKSGSTPTEAKKELEAQILSAQSANIDGVTGATHSTERIIPLVEEILSNR